MREKAILITGGTSGIGYEIAKLFAEDSYNIILVARNEDHLYHVAGILKLIGANDVLVFPCDLTESGSAASVHKFVRSTDYRVEILVNNAGIGCYGDFSHTDYQEDMDMVFLNIIAVMELTKYFLRDMLRSNDGCILQLGDMLNFNPAPQMAVYAATKAFVVSFTESLRQELVDTDVHISILIPGPTETNFYENANMDEDNLKLNDPETVARYAYAAILNREDRSLCHSTRRFPDNNTFLNHENIAAVARQPLHEKEQ